MKRIIAAALSLLALSASCASNPQLDVLFESDWQWTLSHAPEAATIAGDNRYNHRLSNTSLAASRVSNIHQQDMLKEARKINRDTLQVQERLSYDQFVLEKTQLTLAASLYPYAVQPMTRFDGFQLTFPQLVTHTPFNTAIDYHNYLARLHAFPVFIDGIIEQMQAGMKAGWVAPALIIAPLPQQLREFRLNLMESELARPFKNIPVTLPRPEIFAQLGNKELSSQVAPALLRLENFITTQYLPACRDSIAASGLPAGMPYYDFLIKKNTTSNLSAQEIHELGLSEVARLQAELQRVIKQAGFKGSLNEFRHFLATDPHSFYTSSDALLEGYRTLVQQAYHKLPELFARLPKTPLEVQAMPLINAENRADSDYLPPNDYAGGTGILSINISGIPTREKWKMEALTLRDSIPGHHIRNSLANEASELPAFRRKGNFETFSEGWALYAESLGEDIGFYTDPYSKFAYLNDALFRAACLVVDTGIHALGWNHKQAINYLNETIGIQGTANQTTVDYIIARPAQVLGQQLGLLKIRELRTKASLALGGKFDVRTFHNAILDNGPLSLPLLETQIDVWINQQQTTH